ncbi:Glycosyl transferase [Chitinispirillum alkaliphilum]|nr:Glycosyl transferase [Chitinispirillum alkaliphilum]
MKSKSSELNYVIITPARNEELFIEGLIKSMVAQTVRPKRWVIVSDGSTDRTDQIVRKYAEKHKWIELVRTTGHKGRQFAAKVYSFDAGYRRLGSAQYDIIGNVDADVSFEPDFFEFILGKFIQFPSLGVAGAPFVENGKRVYDHGFVDLSHVSGACQLFRRECFEEIGGYMPIRGGGIDWAAVTSARMRGWMTRTFPEKEYQHHRKMGTGNSSYLLSRYRHGQKDHYLGGHPLWQVCRSCFQMTRRPYVFGGLFLLMGYFDGYVRRVRSPIPGELVAFHRSEQMTRLKSMMFKRLFNEA